MMSKFTQKEAEQIILFWFKFEKNYCVRGLEGHSNDEFIESKPFITAELVGEVLRLYNPQPRVTGRSIEYSSEIVDKVARVIENMLFDSKLDICL